MSKITINGITYQGENITVKNGQVIIDGKKYSASANKINISVEGNVNELQVDSCEQVTVNGEIKGDVKTMSGDVVTTGPIAGSVSTMSGNVHCLNIGGAVSTMSGDIKR